ncbi:MAG: hypothetical protein KatS3mg105_3250 [Gemmatales bacterium]|nr:MAG: hypothetical protein KatS3mg105_3250 [Gemmatales bacterium]
MSVRRVAIGDIHCGVGQPLLWILGPCVIESHDLTLRIADRLKSIASQRSLPLIFKASFDKANRSSSTSFRGARAGRRLADFGNGQAGNRLARHNGHSRKGTGPLPWRRFATCYRYRPFWRGKPISFRQLGEPAVQ